MLSIFSSKYKSKLKYLKTEINCVKLSFVNIKTTEKDIKFKKVQ